MSHRPFEPRPPVAGELEAYAELAQLAERWRIRSQTTGAQPKPGHTNNMSNAIPGLVLNPAKGTSGFRVVGVDANACPRHYGVFVDRAHADRYAVKTNEEAFQAGVDPSRYGVRVVAFRVR